MSNSFFQYISVKTWPNVANKATKPMFSGPKNMIEVIRNCFNERLYPFDMQISSAIMQNAFFQYNSVKTWPNVANKATKPMFSGPKNMIEVIKNWFDERLYPFDMQISSAIMQNAFFHYKSVKTWPNVANKATKPMFSGLKNMIEVIRNWFNERLYPFDMQISSAIMQNAFFRYKSVKTWPNVANNAIKPMFSGSKNTIK